MGQLDTLPRKKKRKPNNAFSSHNRIFNKVVVIVFLFTAMCNYTPHKAYNCTYYISSKMVELLLQLSLRDTSQENSSPNDALEAVRFFGHMQLNFVRFYHHNHR